MNCPVDGTTLSIADRQGVEIDHCPQCRGVWLDRGELDKIIDRASRYEHGRDRDDDDFGRESDEHGRRGRRGRESFLGDLFDFGD